MPHPAEESQKHNLSKIRPHSLGAFYGRAQRPDDYRKGALLKLVEEYVVMISASLIYLGVKHVSLPPGYGAHPDLGFAKTYFDNDDGLESVREHHV